MCEREKNYLYDIELLCNICMNLEKKVNIKWYDSPCKIFYVR